jgi:transcriptional regulator with XRE-family HTH domain
MPDAEQSLGELLRDARVRSKAGLREFARDLGIAPSYLSDIETDRRTPTERLLSSMATKLDLDFDVLMALSGRLGEQTDQYVREVPAAARLFRRISALGLNEQEIERLENEIEPRR